MSRRHADQGGRAPRPHVQADQNPPRRRSSPVPRLPTDIPTRLKCSWCGRWSDRAYLVQQRQQLVCREGCGNDPVESYAPNGCGREEAG